MRITYTVTKNVTDKKCQQGDNLRSTKIPKSIPLDAQEKILLDLQKGYPVSNVLALLQIDEDAWEVAVKNREFRRKVNEAKAKYIRPVMDKVLGTAADSIENAWRLLERKAKDDFGKGSTEDERTINVRVRTFDVKGKVKK
jgi:hypothetical protein